MIQQEEVAEMPAGRPRKEIDKTQFEKLCALQCTLQEIADVMDCSGDTIERWCERMYNMKFADVYKKYSAAGKMSLRRTQFRLAEKSAAMAIFLGKQYLGQSDSVTVSAPQVDSMISSIAKQMFDKQPE